MHIRSFPAYHLPHTEMYRGSQGSTGLLFLMVWLSWAYPFLWLYHEMVTDPPNMCVGGCPGGWVNIARWGSSPHLYVGIKLGGFLFFSTRRSMIYNLQSVFIHGCIAVIPIPGFIIGYRLLAARLVPWLLRNVYVSSLPSGCYTVSLGRQGDVNVQRPSNGALAPRAFSLISTIP